MWAAPQVSDGLAAMDITQVLLSAQSPTISIRNHAEQQILQAESANTPLLMTMLCAELANEAKEPNVRQLAGVILKNCVVGQAENIVEEKRQRWLATDPAARNQIKAGILQTLHSPVSTARHTSAQVAAAIAIVELPENQWPELIAGLVHNVTSSDNDHAKESSLETLGFICEEIDPDHLKSQCNQILTAVVSGMRQEQPNEAVRLAATQAMLNALDFVNANFENEQERNYIMQTVCETTQAASLKLKKAAFEVIVRVAELYYQKLPAYMQALFSLTTAAIQAATAAHSFEDDELQDELGRQAVEFWSTICEEELELMEEASTDPSRACHNFVKGAAPHIVPLLLEALCKQEEDQDDDDAWNMAMAAATCLAKIAQTIEDDVVDIVMPFIQKYIADPDWRRREAATLSFGSILEGPSEAKIGPFIPLAMDVMIKHMSDPSVQVKDTAAWTIGRICEHHIRSITQEHWVAMTRPQQPNQGPESRGVLLRGLEDDPRVAHNICWAIHNLAEHCEETKDHATNPLSALFVDLVRALLACTERPDAGEAHLRMTAYETLNTMLTNAALDTREHIKQILPVIIDRLEKSFKMQIVSSDDKEAQAELQGLLCGTLQVTVQKLDAEATPWCDAMMALFLQVFGAKNSTVHEEALMAVGAVSTATEAGFEKYMMHFRPFLSLGLSNYEEHQVCQVAVGVVGDICRALEAKVEPYCDEIVGLLLRDLQNPNLNRNVKPPILSCFGDIALAVGGGFEKYMQITMDMLVQASQTRVDASNPDMLDYLNQLREGIFEAYTGILQGLRTGDKAAAFEPYVIKALEFLGQLATELQTSPPSDEVMRAAVGVVGDLACTLGVRFKVLAKQAPHKDYLKLLLKEARSPNSSDSTKQVAMWAHQQIA